MTPEEFIKAYVEKSKQAALRYIEQTNRDYYTEDDMRIISKLNYDNIQYFLSISQMQDLTSEEKQNLYDNINSISVGTGINVLND